MNNFILIRSSYHNRDISRLRLEITRITCIPSLESQICKNFTVVLSVNKADPFLNERIWYFKSVCPNLVLSYKTTELRKATYTNGDEWKTVSRMDDDDIIGKNYFANIDTVKHNDELFLSHPLGCVYYEGKVHGINYPGNMFVTLKTKKNITPFDEVHARYPNIYKDKTIDVSKGERGWVWVRHNNTVSATLGHDNRPNGHLRRWVRQAECHDTEQFPYDWLDIQKTIKRYAHRRQVKCRFGVDPKAEKKVVATPKPEPKPEPKPTPKRAFNRRFDIINHLIQKKGYKTYLEIGCFRGDNFLNILCPTKVGVDPDPNRFHTVCQTSDEFFDNNSFKFDMIFIDGMHTYAQSKRDLINSINALSEGGTIVMHDCNPRREYMQRSFQDFRKTGGGWNGQVWKTFVEFRLTRRDLNMYTVNMDEGCGVITAGKQDLPGYKVEKALDFKFFAKHREELLNLISREEFLKLP